MPFRMQCPCVYILARQRKGGATARVPGGPADAARKCVPTPISSTQSSASRIAPDLLETAARRVDRSQVGPRKNGALRNKLRSEYVSLDGLHHGPARHAFLPRVERDRR